MSTPTVPQTIASAQANKETPLQEDIRATCHQSVYAYREATSSGLTFGYHGGRWGGFSVAAGTLALTGSATNYIVVLRSSGVPSVSTSSTNWNDSANYARVYRVTTDGSGITNLYGSDFDYRAGPGGVHGSAASAGAGTELRGLTFTADTGSTADSDPGAGLFKWNNATQGSATKLFIDEETADAVNLDTLFGNLSTGLLFIQQSDDADRWQLWRFAAVVDDTGYYDFTVTLQAKGADIEDGRLCYFDFDSEPAPSVGGSGTKTYAVCTPMTSQPPASNFATLDTRNSIAVLDFDAGTDEAARWVLIMPEAASLGSGLQIIIKWMASTATSGTCRWGARIMNLNTDLDTDSFDTAATAGGAASGTSGIPTSTTITLTTIDSVVAGGLYMLEVYRDADGTSGTDDMSGDAELIAVEVRSAA